MTEQELKIALDRWFNRNWNHFRNEVATNIANGQMSSYADDLCMVIFEAFIKKPHAQKLQMYQDNKILNWMLSAASFQIKSGSSPFYNIHRKKRAHAVPDYYITSDDSYSMDDETIEDLYNCMMECIEGEKIEWYYAKILELKYFRGMTKKEMKEQYGFSAASIHKHMAEAIDAVREYCEKKQF
jgi:DNA-directed RNA polymerase specialized sigma24 family protein